MPGYRKGCPPPNKGLRYPADPPRPEEIIAVMRQARGSAYGLRIRGLVVVLWRAGLRIGEALALRWQHVDLGTGTLYIVDSKTDKGVREVHLTPALRE